MRVPSNMSEEEVVSTINKVASRLAQQLASQGQLAAQQASASIGQQDAANQAARARGAASVQDMQRQAQLTVAGGEAQAQAQRLRGAEASRALQYGKTQGLLGMASGELQAATGAVQAGKDRLMGGVGDWFGATDQAMKDVLGMFTGGAPMGGGSGGNATSMTDEEKEWEKDYQYYQGGGNK